MDDTMSSIMKKFSRYESEISSILGMLVVASLAIFIFFFFKRVLPKPSISPTGQTTTQTDTQLTQPTPTTYVVKQGQGLWQIAKDVYKDGYKYMAIVKANKLKAPYIVRAGQTLVLPTSDEVAAIVTPLSKKAAIAMAGMDKINPSTPPTPTENAVGTASSVTQYIVEKGDNLWRIAVKVYQNGYAWVKLYKANRKLIGMNPGKLFAGTTLTVPQIQ